MYASRTVCSRCSSQIRSLSAHVPGTRALIGTASDDTNPLRTAFSSPSSSSSSSSPSSLQTEGHRRPLKPQPIPHRKLKKSAQESAVALFQDVVGSNSSDSINVGKKAAAGNASSLSHHRHHNHQSSPLSEWEIAGKIKEMKNNRILLEDQFVYFKAEIWPHIHNMGGQLPKHVYHQTLEFLHAVRTAIIRSKSPRMDQFSVEVCRMLASVGNFQLDVRNEIVLHLCYKLSTGHHDDAQATIRQLVGMWKHISQLKRPGELNADLQFVLPSEREVLADMEERFKVSGPQSDAIPVQSKALAAIFLQYRPEETASLMSGLVCTMAVLTDKQFSKWAVLEDAGRLLTLVSAVLAEHPLDESYTNELFEAESKVPREALRRLQNYVNNKLPRINEVLREPGTSWQTNAQNSKAKRGSASGGGPKLSVFYKQLKRAYLSRQPGPIMSIWVDMTKALQNHPELYEQLAKEPDFLDFWIYVWCAVRRSQNVQVTLELMSKVGVQPTIKTYTSMMHGWKLCRDLDKIEALWAKLVESGMKLDSVAWTARISGLVEGGKPKEGIMALTEMVEQWKTAVRTQRQQFAVEPTIEVVNATFKGLLPIDKNAANEVLSWAAREGFEPNIRTYNILLRETFRSDAQDAHESITNILQAMRGQGVEPDSATFTILLEEVLGRMEDASPEEHVQAVGHIFEDIAAAGLKPNFETYGKMLYAVSSLANGSKEAIEAVQAHMRKAGFRISSHMITILIERASAQSPPDIKAVRTLLRKHNITDISKGDQTLWERVVSVYSVGGETNDAMAIFDKLAAAGTPVTSLLTLTDLLITLLEVQAWESAHRVVQGTLTHKLNNREVDDRYWNHRFWHLARESGLLSGKELPSELEKK